MYHSYTGKCIATGREESLLGIQSIEDKKGKQVMETRSRDESCPPLGQQLIHESGGGRGGGERQGSTCPSLFLSRHFEKTELISMEEKKCII